MNKTKSTYFTADGQVGTAGRPGYVHAVIVVPNAAAGTADLYEGSNTTGTRRLSLMAPNVAGDARSVSGLNLWFPNGCYLDLTTAFVTVEYSGF